MCNFVDFALIVGICLQILVNKIHLNTVIELSPCYVMAGGS